MGYFANPFGYHSKFTGDTAGPDFCKKFCISAPKFALIIEELTKNTYVMVVLPPGEAEVNCARLNIGIARERFTSMDILSGREHEDGQGVGSGRN